MRSLLTASALVLSLLPAAALAAAPAVKHFSPGLPGAPGPAFSGAVMAGDTLYLSGTIDAEPGSTKPPPAPKDGAKVVMDSMKRSVEAAGLTMDDLVWVQVFASDLKNYAVFNEVYRTYFKGPMPARAFLGAGSLLGGANFEVMGIAVKGAK